MNTDGVGDGESEVLDVDARECRDVGGTCGCLKPAAQTEAALG